MDLCTLYAAHNDSVWVVSCSVQKVMLCLSSRWFVHYMVHACIGTITAQCCDFRDVTLLASTHCVL